jgi:hypothetical protein
MKSPTQKQIAAILALAAPARYEHFIKVVADADEVWGLRGAGGWTFLGDSENRQSFPVWPRSEYAALCAADAHQESPSPILMQEFLERWLPGLEKDGRLVAVFPTPTGQGIVVPPRRLRDDLAAYVKDWYGEG